MTRRLSALVCASALALSTSADRVDRLDGLWSAYKRFGPQLEGPLLLDPAMQRAQIGPYSVAVSHEGATIRFELPSNAGRFVGRVGSAEIVGHWIQPPPVQIGQPMASPVVLKKLPSGVWHGLVRPKPSEYTFYLPIRVDDEGVRSTFLRNPDRNLGVFANLKRVERSGSDLSFIGGFGRSSEEQQIAAGSFDAENDVLTLQLPPWRGGAYEFSRVGRSEHSYFHPQGTREATPWTYVPPPTLDDGWSTSSLDEAGIDAGLIARMINEEIVTPDDSVHAHRVHGVLIARHGKLVLEEYFHGFDRDTHHDTRSASKSVVSMLVGAAAHAGAELGVDTPVFDTLLGAQEGAQEGAQADRDRSKQAMTLGHLLTMSSGFYCDDNDSNAPGNENTLQEQTDQPNWYQYTLDLPMAEPPGTSAIYCSANSNLIGAVVSKAVGRSLMQLVDELIAKPLDIRSYYLGLQPTGEVYFGGGAQWLPRDFMKIGQVMLDGGIWNGRRVLSESWVAASIAQQVLIDDRGYGYQWWLAEYPYQDGTVKAFYAAGNGGQIVMGVPELDLTIAFYGGNYSDPVLFRAQNVLVPEYILKATSP